ncbi:beta-fructofuranosidase, insoluble isoenzyme CWINV1-like protein, partial [Tanacetum coccineum]
EGRCDMTMEGFMLRSRFMNGDKKRRVLWSWINEGDSEPDDKKKGWSGLRLSENGDQLVQWPVKELEKLRKRKVHYENKELKGGSIFQISGVTASQADVEITFSLSNLNDAEVLSSEVVDPKFFVHKRMHQSSLRQEVDKTIYGAYSALDLIDHSIVESFGGGGLACITARVYPKLAVEEQAQLYAFNNGSQSLIISSLSAWSMKKAQIVSIGKRRKHIK